MLYANAIHLLYTAGGAAVNPGSQPRWSSTRSDGDPWTGCSYSSVPHR